MKGRASVSLLTASQADAELLRADLQNWLDGRNDRWTVEGEDPLVEPPLRRPTWAVVADLAFETRLAAEQLLQKIQNVWTTGPLSARVLAGSSVALHDCDHDTLDGSCLVDQVATKP